MLASRIKVVINFLSERLLYFNCLFRLHLIKDIVYSSNYNPLVILEILSAPLQENLFLYQCFFSKIQVFFLFFAFM